jgi:NADH dehydrogenase
VPLAGIPAKLLGRAYHLLALPGNRLRVVTDWCNDVVEHRQFVRLGLVRDPQARLVAAEPMDLYYRSDGRQLGDRTHADTGPTTDAARLPRDEGCASPGSKGSAADPVLPLGRVHDPQPTAPRSFSLNAEPPSAARRSES